MTTNERPSHLAPRELLIALLIASVAFAVPLWEGLVRSDTVVFGVDTVTSQLPWSPGIQADLDAAGDPVIRPRNQATADQGHQFYPLYLWAARSWEAGELPAWNPDIYAGAPGLANPQAGVLDPQVAPLFALHALGGRPAFDRGLVFMAWMRLIAAGVGAYLLARMLGLLRGPSAFAGLAFGMSGYVLLWLNWSLGHVAPLLPWVLVGLEAARGARPWRAAAGTALALALAVLAGHPETSFYVGAVGGLWALSILREDRRAGLIGLAGLAVGTLASGASLVPFIEYLFLSGAKVIRDAMLVEAGFDVTALGLVFLLGAMCTWYARAAVGASVAGAPGARRHAILGAIGLALAFVGAGTIFLGRGLEATAPLVLWPDLFGAPGDDGGYRGAGVYVEVASGWIAFAALGLALASILTPSGVMKRRSLAAGIGVVALLLCMELPGALDLYRRVPLIGLGATERLGPVSGLFLSLLAADALQSAPRIARGTAACVLGVLAAVTFAPADVERPPAELTPVDVEDGHFGVVLAPADEMNLLDLNLEGWIHPGLPVERATLRVARLDEQGRPIGSSCVDAPIDLSSRPTAKASARASDKVAAAPEGALWFRAPILVPSAMEAGTWRFAIDLFGPDSREVPMGTRVLSVSHLEREHHVRPITVALLGASLLLLFVYPGGAGAAWIAGWILLLLMQCFWFARGLNPAVPVAESFPATRTEAILTEVIGPYRFLSEPNVLPPNSGLVHELRSLDGYDAMDVADFNWYRSLCLPPGANGLLAWNARGVLLDNAAFRLLGVGVLALAGPLEESRNGGAWELVASPEGPREAETWIYRATDPVPRAFCVPAVIELEELGAQLDAGTWDPLQSACIDGDWRPTAPFTSAEVGEPVWTNNTVRVSATLDGDGLLVLTDQAFPGWRVEVDGEERELFTANGIFRGVAVGAGAHEIVFTYEPWTISIGMMLSGFGLALGVAFLLMDRWRGATPSY